MKPWPAQTAPILVITCSSRTREGISPATSSAPIVVTRWLSPSGSINSASRHPDAIPPTGYQEYLPLEINNTDLSPQASATQGFPPKALLRSIGYVDRIGMCAGRRPTYGTVVLERNTHLNFDWVGELLAYRWGDGESKEEESP
jgi:hypothetical protein